MPIPGNDLLQEFENQGGAATKLGIFLRRYIVPPLQTVARSAGVNTSKQLEPPPTPDSVNVTTAGELMQVTINHNAPLNSRTARYFTEVSADDPSFMSGPMIHDHGASRAPLPIQLPTKGSAGTTHNYYVASYVQYPGGPPSKPVYYGGTSPTPIQMSGTTQMDIQPGKGSGTASSSAPTPFQGMGKTPIRN